MAKDFNQVVAIDIKEYKKGDKYFLHMVDMATRFSKSCVTKSKKPKEIVEKVTEIWLGTDLGVSVKFLCDNNGLFANTTFLDMCAKYEPSSNAYTSIFTFQ